MTCAGSPSAGRPSSPKRRCRQRLRAVRSASPRSALNAPVPSRSSMSSPQRKAPKRGRSWVLSEARVFGAAGGGAARGWIRTGRPRCAACALVPCGAERPGHRAEVLTHDDRICPVRLQCDHGVKLLGPVGHVRTVGRAEPSRDHVHPLQTHHVVDAQAIGVRKGTSQRSGEEAVPVFADSLRVEGPESPTLSTGEEAVRWRSALHLRDEGLR